MGRPAASLTLSHLPLKASPHPRGGFAMLREDLSDIAIIEFDPALPRLVEFDRLRPKTKTTKTL